MAQLGPTIVFGDLTATASSALWADVAEKYTCENKELQKGTVMAVSRHPYYDVEECREECSNCAVGVISEAPALTMNSMCDGVTVGLLGRIPVRVIGSIEKGDFIVSAGNGLARKGESGELIYKIGFSLEDNIFEEEKIVECLIK